MDMVEFAPANAAPPPPTPSCPTAAHYINCVRSQAHKGVNRVLGPLSFLLLIWPLNHDTKEWTLFTQKMYDSSSEH
jgi:hypothetical protein